MSTKFYYTEDAKILIDGEEALAPVNLRNKSAEEIIAYCQEHWNIEFDADGRSIPQNKSTAYMMAVAEAIFDPERWKNPIKAMLPRCGQAWAAAAVVWYHGAEAIDTGYVVFSYGYAC